MRQIQFTNREAIRELKDTGFPIDPKFGPCDQFTGWLVDDHVFAGRCTIDGEEEDWRVSLYPWGIALSPFFDTEESVLEYALKVVALKFDWPRLLALPDPLNNPEYREAARKLSELYASYVDDDSDGCAMYDVPDDLDEARRRLS